MAIEVLSVDTCTHCRVQIMQVRDTPNARPKWVHIPRGGYISKDGYLFCRQQVATPEKEQF